VTFFEFPPSIRAACEQYLVYFGQFLEDLGIHADSEIKRHAGSVMFCVTPSDGPTALAAIRDALEAYLQLPTAPELHDARLDTRDPALTQLKANVRFLQSQLELSRAIVEAKDATIQAMDVTIYRQQQLITGDGLYEFTTPGS
jgi:hypothetical protein